jgi:hypothetical protein
MDLDRLDIVHEFSLLFKEVILDNIAPNLPGKNNTKPYSIFPPLIQSIDRVVIEQVWGNLVQA